MVRKHTINLDGKQLCIGHHSWTALWQVRLHRLPMLLWMDVLSIDQTNAKEKSTQVDMMGSIYSAAKLTCVSLGDHGDDSKFLVEQIRAHTYHIEHLWAKSTGLRESISACSACGLPPTDRMYRCKQCGGSHNICLACKKAHSDKLQRKLFLNVLTKSQFRGECVNQRRDVVDEEDLHSDRTQLSLFANPNENSRIVLTVRSHCKVWQNEIGQYIVPAERSNASWRENEHFEVEKSNARSLQTPAGHVVGLANKQIRSGDILLLFRIDGDRKIFPAGLITLPCDGKMHLIVGQFVVDGDITICHNEASCACEGHHEGDGLGSSTWKVHMLPEDLLLFVTQDLNLRPKQGSTPSRTESREEGTRPLTTRVISQPFSSYAMLKPEHPLSEEYRR